MKITITMENGQLISLDIPKCSIKIESDSIEVNKSEETQQGVDDNE